MPRSWRSCSLFRGLSLVLAFSIAILPPVPIAVASEGAVSSEDAAGLAYETPGYEVLESNEAGLPSVLGLPDGLSAALEYGADGRVAGLVHPDESRESFSYDELGRFLAYGDVTGGETRIEYSQDDFVDSVRLADGNRVRFERDEARRLASMEDPSGGVYAFDYDSMDRVTGVRRPVGSALRFAWDEADRPTMVDVPPDGEYRFQWDPEHLERATAIVDPAGRETTIQHDAQGRVETIRSPAGGTIRFERDEQGRLRGIDNAKGRTLGFDYKGDSELPSAVITYPAAGPGDGAGHKLAIERDELGRTSSLVFADGTRRTFGYGSGGRVNSVRLRDGAVLGYEHDAMGRTKRVQLGGKTVSSFGYDVAGRPTTVMNEHASSLIQYDVMGRPVAVDDILEDRGSLGFRYDASGRVTGIETPWGQIGYAYDAAGRVQTVTLPGEEAGSIKLAWTADDRLARIEYPNGVAADYETGAAGEPKAMRLSRDGEALLGHVQAYDERGLAAGEVFEAAGRTIRTSYEHDEAGRLVAVVGAKETRWELGPDARRVAEFENGQRQAIEYDRAGRLVREGEYRFEYDAEGRLAARHGPRGTDRYEWDAFGRLRGASLAPDEAGARARKLEFAYDAVGRPVRRTADGIDEHYVQLGPQRLATLDAKRELKAFYIPGPGFDRPLAVLTPAGVSFIHGDARGDIVARTDSDGAVTGTWRYGPFGEIEAAEGLTLGTAGDAEQPFGYRGRLLDPDLGWWDFRARWLDPDTGRFTAEEPLGPTVTPDLYTYSGHSPLHFVDPDGRFLNVLIGATVGAVAGAVVGAVSYAIESSVSGEPFDLGRMAAKMAGGAASGAVTGTLMSVGVPPMIAVVAGGAVGGAVETVADSYATTGGPPTAAEILGGAATGAVLSGVGYGVGKVVAKVAAPLARPLSRAVGGAISRNVGGAVTRVAGRLGVDGARHLGNRAGGLAWEAVRTGGGTIYRYGMKLATKLGPKLGASALGLPVFKREWWSDNVYGTAGILGDGMGVHSYAVRDLARDARGLNDYYQRIIDERAAGQDLAGVNEVSELAHKKLEQLHDRMGLHHERAHADYQDRMGQLDAQRGFLARELQLMRENLARLEKSGGTSAAGLQGYRSAIAAREAELAGIDAQRNALADRWLAVSEANQQALDQAAALAGRFTTSNNAKPPSGRSGSR